MHPNSTVLRAVFSVFANIKIVLQKPADQKKAVIWQIAKLKQFNQLVSCHPKAAGREFFTPFYHLGHYTLYSIQAFKKFLALTNSIAVYSSIFLKNFDMLGNTKSVSIGESIESFDSKLVRLLNVPIFFCNPSKLKQKSLLSSYKLRLQSY